MEDIISIVMGVFLGLALVPRKTSTYQVACQGWPIDEPNDNLALIGVGLASARPSVMDASPAAVPQMAIMDTPPAPMMMPPPAPVPMMPPSAPVPMIIRSPVPMMTPQAPVPKAPAPVQGTPCVLQKLDPRTCVTSSDAPYRPYNVNITPPTNGGESCDAVAKRQFGPTWSIRQTPYGTALVDAPGGC